MSRSFNGKKLSCKVAHGESGCAAYFNRRKEHTSSKTRKRLIAETGPLQKLSVQLKDKLDNYVIKLCIEGLKISAINQMSVCTGSSITTANTKGLRHRACQAHPNTTRSFRRNCTRIAIVFFACGTRLPGFLSRC